jgi:pyruvate kinase
MKELTQQINTICKRVVEMDGLASRYIEDVHSNWKVSASNFIHYLTLRTFDMIDLQDRLSELSISSIAHSEAYTYNNLTNVLRLLYLLQEQQWVSCGNPGYWPTYRDSRKLLFDHTKSLFPNPNENQSRYTMVTLPSEAASEPRFIHDMLIAGMDIVRINTGHDNPETWDKMIFNVRRGMATTSLPCLIYFDLAGPKIRTGAVSCKKREDQEGNIRVFEGDVLLLTRDKKISKPKEVKEYVGVPDPICISLTVPSILDDLEVGHRVWFDDGKIGGIIERNISEGSLIRITNARKNGVKLREEKGINFPDSVLSLPSLSSEDHDYLSFIVRHADMLGYSYVQTAEDVHALQNELLSLGNDQIGLVLKIETRRAFERFPELILAGMKWPVLGVMVARGDLAVEVGFERISEVQEELLWLCEAAHVPVIWATQVLENLAKKGIASRAEITDAAMSVRAECVMLNKGPYVVEAIQVLKNILQRMEYHQAKKKGTLRALNVAQGFIHQFDENVPAPVNGQFSAPVL